VTKVKVMPQTNYAYFFLQGTLVSFCCVFCTILFANEKTSSIININDSLVVVANQFSNSVSFITTDITTENSNYKVQEIQIGLSPQTVAYDEDTNSLWVTAQEENLIAILSIPNRELIGHIKTENGPFGVIFTKEAAFVSLQYADLIQVFDKYNFIKIAEILVDNQPRGMTLSSDGRSVLVTHFIDGKISKLDAKNFELVDILSLGSRAGLVQSISIDNANQIAYIPNTLRNTDNTKLAFDTTVFPFVSIIDLDDFHHLRANKIPLDIIDEPVGIPLESLLIGGILYVLNASSNDMTLIDTKTVQAIGHIQLGSYPLGITSSTDAQTIYVDNALDGVVSVINSESLKIVSNVQVTKIPIESDILEGLKLFNSSDDTRMSKDQWISCATCHFDGLTDNQVWHFPDGLRNTPSLEGVAHTPPFHWSGNLDELQDVEATIRDIQGGSGLSNGDDNCDPSCDLAPSNKNRTRSLDNLAKFMESLKFSNVESLNKRIDNPLVAIGENIFNDREFDCASCHEPPFFTDGKNHILTFSDGNQVDINTPSLLNIEKSSPYLHDGSKKTLESVFNKQPMDLIHGALAGEDSDKIIPLVEYLKNLSPPNDQITPNLTDIVAPQKTNIPKTALSNIDIGLKVINENDLLAIEIFYKDSGNIPYETYIVIENRDLKKSWVFSSAKKVERLSSLNKIPPIITHDTAFSIHEHNFKIYLNKPNKITQNYLIHAVTVEKEKSPKNRDNWLSYDSKEFSL